MKDMCSKCGKRSKCYINETILGIINVMDRYSPVDIEYFGGFRTKFSDGLFDSWCRWLKHTSVDLDDFLYNCILSIADSDYSNIMNKSKIKDVITRFETDGTAASYDSLRIRQKMIDMTKIENLTLPNMAINSNENNETKNKPPKYRRNIIYEKEIQLAMKEKTMDEKGSTLQKSSNPLLKLAQYKNIDTHNFTSYDLDSIICFYDKLYEDINSNKKLSSVEKLLILYHTELDLRFETNFKILSLFKKHKIDSKIALDYSRGFTMIKSNDHTNNTWWYKRNKVFYGIEKIVDIFCELMPQDIEYVNVLIHGLYDVSDTVNEITKVVTKTVKRRLVDHLQQKMQCEFIEDMMTKVPNKNTFEKNSDDIRIKDFVEIYKPDEL